MNKKILIISKSQFGYFTDYYKFCEYLRTEFDVYYLCFDVGLKKINMKNVKVKYVSYKGNKIIRGFRFFLKAIITIASFRGIVLISYFEHCHLLRCFFPSKKMILDIRTLSINKNEKRRKRINDQIRKTAKYFSYVTTLSAGLKRLINLNSHNCFIIPLGADIISNNNKRFEKDINLLYVGTFSGRNIQDTIIGLHLFLKRNSGLNSIGYDIIGYGYGNENAIFKKIVAEYQLEGIVNLHGRIPICELKSFFDKCNVGISYVPITDYYEYQPVTKTYEYILSGMACIATNTFENRKIINDINGVLCDSNPNSFAVALEELIKRFKNYDSEKIRKTAIEYTWENIVKLHLIPLLQKV